MSVSKITVIDDDKTTCKIIKNILNKSGFSVNYFTDPQMAKKSIVSSDLLITDICMPELDGIELIQELRKDNSSVKILLISSHGRYTEASKKIGADDSILKPISSKELLSKVGNLLKST